MWGVGLTLCIAGILSLTQNQKMRSAMFWFALILVGLGAMYVGQ